MGILAFSLSKDGDTQLTKNFKVREFACKDGSDIIFIDEEVVTILQCIRSHFGKPVTVNSAYRTIEHNKKVGGVNDSQHLIGKACDIVVKDISPKEVANFAENLLHNYGGIGIYSTFTHIDVRETRARWNGK